MSDLIDFASALCAKASPGPSGRVFRVWPWGADQHDPDALITLVSAGGHVLAQTTVRASEWARNSEAGKVGLLTAALRDLVARAIKPTMDRPLRRRAA